MPILSLNFLLYTIGGVWRPIKWSSRCSKLLYGLFTCCSLYLLSFIMLTQFLALILVIDNIDDFIANSLIFISLISLMFKVSTAVSRRGDIINALRILQAEPCTTCNEEEFDIQSKFDNLIRSCSISYTLLCAVSLTGAVAGGTVESLGGRLPYEMWIPYGYTSFYIFWSTVLQGTMAMAVGTVVNVATETMVLGFCLQVCAQLEILKHRLRGTVRADGNRELAGSSSSDAPSQSGGLSEHISHHLCIIRFVKQMVKFILTLAGMINDIFSQVIFVQFFVSILVLCASLYYMTSHTNLTDTAPFVVYSFSMFVQIFVYCWAGNEVTLKSVEVGNAAYEMEWILMTISEQKDLLMIMMRSTRPIKLTSSFLVTLSLSSYSNLLKASYSAFNVL